jgi:hypothetical protein
LPGARRWARPRWPPTSPSTSRKAWKEGRREDGTIGTVDGGVVGFFSLEMSSSQLAQRILSEAAEIPSELIRKGDLTEAEFQRYLRAAGELEHCPLYIDDTPALPISQVAARARRLKRSPKGLDLLIIDYLQLVRPATAKDSRVNEVSEITQGLKAIAKELDIPVIALSQLSRQVENREDKRPQLSDLRESGSIEQDADVVMFVYRGEYYKEREKPGEDNLEAMTKWQQDMEALHGKAEVIIGKQRHGPVGSVELSFEGKFTRFGNLVKPWQQGADARRQPQRRRGRVDHADPPVVPHVAGRTDLAAHSIGRCRRHARPAQRRHTGHARTVQPDARIVEDDRPQPAPAGHRSRVKPPVGARDCDRPRMAGAKVGDRIQHGEAVGHYRMKIHDLTESGNQVSLSA